MAALAARTADRLGPDEARARCHVDTSGTAAIAAGDMVGDLMRIAHHHQLQLPPNLALLFKVLAMLESAAVLIDPEFLFFQALESEITEHLILRASPIKTSRRVGRNALDMVRLAEGFPRRAERLLQRLETGDIELANRHATLESGVERIVRTLGILTAVIAVVGFLVGASIYAVAAEAGAAAESNRLNILLILFGAGGAMLAVLIALIWRMRKR